MLVRILIFFSWGPRLEGTISNSQKPCSLLFSCYLSEFVSNSIYFLLIFLLSLWAYKYLFINGTSLQFTYSDSPCCPWINKKMCIIWLHITELRSYTSIITSMVSVCLSTSCGPTLTPWCGLLVLGVSGDSSFGLCLCVWTHCPAAEWL